jgi:hypothetical protein
VRAFHAAALAAGYEDNGAPGERTVYHPGYYGAFVLDPDSCLPTSSYSPLTASCLLTAAGCRFNPCTAHSDPRSRPRTAWLRGSFMPDASGMLVAYTPGYTPGRAVAPSPDAMPSATVAYLSVTPEVHSSSP